MKNVNLSNILLEKIARLPEMSGLLITLARMCSSPNQSGSSLLSKAFAALSITSKSNTLRTWPPYTILTAKMDSTNLDCSLKKEKIEVLRCLTCHVAQGLTYIRAQTSSVSVCTDQGQEVFLSPFKQRIHPHDPVSHDLQHKIRVAVSSPVVYCSLA